MARFSSLILAMVGLVALGACTAPSPGGSASESGAAAQSSASAAAPVRVLLNYLGQVHLQALQSRS